MRLIKKIRTLPSITAILASASQALAQTSGQDVGTMATRVNGFSSLVANAFIGLAGVAGIVSAIWGCIELLQDHRQGGKPWVKIIVGVLLVGIIALLTMGSNSLFGSNSSSLSKLGI